MQSFKDIAITSLDVHMGFTAEPELIRVFTKDGSFAEESKWVNVCQTKVKGRGPSRITMLPVECFDSITLKAGNVKTFMISSNKKNIISSLAKPSINYIAKMTDDLIVKTGYTIGEEFKPVENSTLWNGVVRYYYTDTEGDDSPSSENIQQGHALSIGQSSSDQNKDPTSSFGIIFTIYSTEKITLEGIQFMTTDTSDNHALNYTLYTKQSSYLDSATYYENIPYFEEQDDWSLISKGQIMKSFVNTQVSNNPHSLLFTENYIHMEKGTNQSFYIALNYDSLYSTTSDTEKSDTGAFASDDYLQVTQSAMVSEHGQISTSIPLGLYKGSIYYSNEFKPPTQAPSTVPTMEPSNATIPHEVNYTFSILYETARQSEVLKAMDSFIFSKLKTVLQDSTLEFFNQLNSGQVQLVSISSSFSEDMNDKSSDCKPTQNTLCSFVQSTVATTYNGYITASMLRFIMLKLSSEANNALPFKHHEYVGIVPLFTEPVVSLGGVEDDQLDGNATSFYEGTVKDFLNEMFSNGSDTNTVRVTDVSTTLQDFAVSSRRLRRDQQKGQDESSGLDIATGVFGEYQPPPEVTFDKLVKESVETNSEVLVQKLKKSPTFKKVKEVELTFVKISPKKKSSLDVEVKTEVEESSQNLGVIIGASLASVVFLMLCLFLSIRSVRSKQGDRDCEDDIYYDNVVTNRKAQNFQESQSMMGGGYGHNSIQGCDVISRQTQNMMQPSYRASRYSGYDSRSLAR